MVQCVGFREIWEQKWNIILMIMFSTVYNHLKLNHCISFFTLELALYIKLGSGSSWSPPFSTAMFLQ